jgi:hypothetical protein
MPGLAEIMAGEQPPTGGWWGTTSSAKHCLRLDQSPACPYVAIARHTVLVMAAQAVGTITAPHRARAAAPTRPAG